MSKFTLITTTRGRYLELRRLFESLRVQTFKGFKVILIDQIGDKDTSNIVYKYSEFFSITHLKTGPLSLSAARNFGLEHADGDFIAFPDDDCYYPQDLLEKIQSKMLANDLGIISCRGYDPESKRELLSNLPKLQTVIKANNIFGIGMSITLFFRSISISGLKFDERLGVGCPAGSGEETDFLIRTFKRGTKGMYFSDVSVFHPYPVPVYDGAVRKRAFAYGLGFGVVLRRHFSLSLFTHLVRSMIVRPLGGMVISVFHPAKFLWCWTVFRARWRGFIIGK